MADQNLQQNKGPWWKEGAQVFSEVSTWIAVPVLLALFGGKWLDARYGTKPKMVLILAGVGFLFSMFGIWRTTMKYAKKLKREAEKNQNNNQQK